MKIYLVTSGSYSDYTVQGAYSTEEKALDAKKFYAANNDIETYELDTLPPHPIGMLWFSVLMDREGRVDRVAQENGEYAKTSEWEPYGTDSDLVYFRMWARDEEHAIKIANERRTVLIATNQWTTDWEAWNKLRGKL